MAMAHPLPSYGQRALLRRRGRSSSAPPPPDITRLREMLRPLDPTVVSTIRQNAKAGWQAEAETISRSATSYSAMHSAKRLDEPTQFRVRPESPNRMNKPHPENVFLVTRLKKIPNYFDPDEAASVKYGGSAKSRLNSYVQENKESIEKVMKKNAIQKRPQSSTSVADRQRVKMRTVFGDVPGQAVEAWTKLSNDKDKAAIEKTINDVLPSRPASSKAATPKPPTPTEVAGRVSPPKSSPRRESGKRRTMPSLRAKPAQGSAEEIYSATRWMKRAGNQENENVRRLMSALRKAPPRKLQLEGPHFHITDYSSMFAPAPRETFYDFQIHPEWHQPWHKQYESRIATKA